MSSASDPNSAKIKPQKKVKYRQLIFKKKQRKMEIDTQTKPHAIEVFKKKKINENPVHPLFLPYYKQSIRGWLLWKREWVGGWKEES